MHAADAAPHWRGRDEDGSAESWEAWPEEERSSFVTAVNPGAQEGSRKAGNSSGEKTTRESAREVEQDGEQGDAQSQSKEVKAG